MRNNILIDYVKNCVDEFLGNEENQKLLKRKYISEMTICFQIGYIMKKRLPELQEVNEILNNEQLEVDEEYSANGKKPKKVYEKCQGGRECLDCGDCYIIKNPILYKQQKILQYIENIENGECKKRMRPDILVHVRTEDVDNENMNPQHNVRNLIAMEVKKLYCKDVEQVEGGGEFPKKEDKAKDYAKLSYLTCGIAYNFKLGVHLSFKKEQGVYQARYTWFVRGKVLPEEDARDIIVQ